MVQTTWAEPERHGAQTQLDDELPQLKLTWAWFKPQALGWNLALRVPQLELGEAWAC